jgi:hypothetical protein
MEMEVLHQNGTWEQVAFLPSKKTIGCKWVYTIKFNLDGSVERLRPFRCEGLYQDLWY